MDAHDNTKFTDGSYFVLTVKFACLHKNFYFLYKFILRLENILADKRKGNKNPDNETGFLNERQFNALLNPIFDVSLDNNQCHIFSRLLGMGTIVHRYEEEYTERLPDDGYSGGRSLKVKKIRYKADQLNLDITKCIEKEGTQILQILLNYFKIGDIARRLPVGNYIEQCIKKGRVDLVEILVDCFSSSLGGTLRVKNDFISLIFSDLSEGKIDKQKARALELLGGYSKVLITHFQDVCESNLFNNEEKRRIL